MAKISEQLYYSSVSEEARVHMEEKPFSDPNCAQYLLELGAIFHLLPPPPGRLLDVGCGTGWTSRFFSLRGYDVVGTDISEDMIQAAIKRSRAAGIKNIDFLTCDYELMPFENEFDVAIFFDALHHAEDEFLALESVYRSLKIGGICITSEPGVGHATSPDSLHAMQQYGVTERDMEPSRIWKAAMAAGFRSHRIFPHTYRLGHYYKMGTRFPGRKPFWLLLKVIEKMIRPRAVERGESIIDVLRLAKGFISEFKKEGIVLLIK